MLKRLPVIQGMLKIDKSVMPFNVLKGRSAETSGGLLAMMPDIEAAQSFCEELTTKYKEEAWIVGEVVSGENKAYISEEVEVIDV